MRLRSRMTSWSLFMRKWWMAVNWPPEQVASNACQNRLSARQSKVPKQRAAIVLEWHRLTLAYPKLWPALDDLIYAQKSATQCRTNKNSIYQSTKQIFRLNCMIASCLNWKGRADSAFDLRLSRWLSPPENRHKRSHRKASQQKPGHEIEM